VLIVVEQAFGDVERGNVIVRPVWRRWGWVRVGRGARGRRLGIKASKC